jgi:hypothetical protein
MFLSHMTSSVCIGTVALTLLLGSAGPVSAAPPPGMRWSDHSGAGGSSPRSSQRTAPALGAVPAIPPAGATGVTAAPAANTITIRGPDGVLRTYPLAGDASVVQSQPGALGQVPVSYVGVRGTDGVVRYYPVHNGPVVYPPVRWCCP